MKKIHKQLQELDDATLVTIHTSDSQQRCPAYVESQEIPYPVAIDGDGSIIESYNVQAFPTMMLVGKDGRIIEDDVWPTDELGPLLERAREVVDEGTEPDSGER